MPDWSQYGNNFVGRAVGHWRDLTRVSHVTHLHRAKKIIRDCEIKSQLVYDESILNQSRTTVVWVSPKEWPAGYRYGSVAFDFNWRVLSSEKHFYWVESIPAYHPAACRILVSEQQGLERLVTCLQPYDPGKSDGPLRVVDRDWFFNDEYTLELMFDENLPLQRMDGLRFVTHHRDFCCEQRYLSNTRCEDRSMEVSDIGAQVAATIIGLQNYTIRDKLRVYEGEWWLRPSTLTAVNGAWRAIRPLDADHGPVSDLDFARKIVRAALMHLAHNQIPHARSLTAQLCDPTLYDQAFTSIVNNHFFIRNYEARPDHQLLPAEA